MILGRDGVGVGGRNGKFMCEPRTGIGGGRVGIMDRIMSEFQLRATSGLGSLYFWTGVNSLTSGLLFGGGVWEM